MGSARGRVAGFRMTNDHRTKIQNSQVLNALIEHVEGRREMSSTQVTAGVALLKKVLPDLAATADVAEDGALTPMKRMTDAELEAIAAGSRSGATTSQESPRKLN